MSPTLLPDEDKNAPSDVSSTIRYFHSLESRVKALESQLARLTGSSILHGDDNVPTSSLPRCSTSASAEPSILRLSRAEFESHDLDGEPIHAIELLVDKGAVIAIRLRSQQLLKRFQEIMGPDLGPSPSISTVIIRPFRALIELWSVLRRDKPAIVRSSIEWSDLNALSEVADSDLSADCLTYITLRQRLRKNIDFLHLSFLFQPGDTVVEGSGASKQAYVVRSAHAITPHIHQDLMETASEEVFSTFVLDCIFVGYDGKAFGPIQRTFSVMHFFGRKEIAKLPVVPIEYLKKEKIQDQLVDRGRRFYALRKLSHKSYYGMSLDQITKMIEGEVVVDFELYYRQNPDKAPVIDPAEFEDGGAHEGHAEAPGTTSTSGYDWSKSAQSSGVYDDSKIDKHLTQVFLRANPACLEVCKCDEDGESGTLSSDQLMLLPSLVWAFDLRGRKWHPLDVSIIRDVEYPENAFDYLVLPSGHKELLASLVSMQGSKNQLQSGAVDDLIVGKGKGLTILFHGPPGVGKTLTAECLAAYAQRPLLPITTADIGDTAHDVEQALDMFFALSQRWGCILLFDEADTILQARDRTDMQRNAIVSVFLRALEYFSGILVLTTNRVGTIDAAFKSRIHLALAFPPLNEDSAMKIWEMTLRRARNSTTIEIDEPLILKFLRKSRGPVRLRNGRDIRNAVQSAIALAEYEHQHEGNIGRAELDPRHIEAILESLNDFSEYLNVVHGSTDSGQARRVGDRNDDYFEKPKYVSRAATKPLYTTSRQGDRILEPLRMRDIMLKKVAEEDIMLEKAAEEESRSKMLFGKLRDSDSD